MSYLFPAGFPFGKFLPVGVSAVLELFVEQLPMLFDLTVDLLVPVAPFGAAIDFLDDQLAGGADKALTDSQLLHLTPQIQNGSQQLATST